MQANNRRAGDSAVSKTDLQRQIDNDAIANEYLGIARARAERMQIPLAEALASTFYILLVDYVEARRISESTFVGEFDSRRGRGKKSE